MAVYVIVSDAPWTSISTGASSDFLGVQEVFDNKVRFARARHIPYPKFDSLSNIKLFLNSMLSDEFFV